MPLPITIRVPKQQPRFWTTTTNVLQAGSFDYSILDTSDSRWPASEDDVIDYTYRLEIGSEINRDDNDNTLDNVFINIGLFTMFLTDSDFGFVQITNVDFNSIIRNNLRVSVVTSTAVTLFEGDYAANRRVVLEGDAASNFVTFDAGDPGIYLEFTFSLNRTNITGGFGTLAFGGDAEVSVNNPVAVNPGGIASLAVGSDTELNIVKVPEVRVGGSPRRNVLMLTLPQVAGVSSWRLVQGSNTYEIAIATQTNTYTLDLSLPDTQYNGLRFEIIQPTTGIAYEGVIGGATTTTNITEADYDAIFGPSTDINNLDNRVLTIYQPDTRETPTLALGSDSELDITRVVPVRLAGIGTLAIAGDSALEISSILQQLPVTVILPRTAANIWTSDPATTEQRLFAGTAANRAITITRSGRTLTISITGNVDFDDDVEESNVLFSIWIGGRTYILFRDVTGASHIADHPYEYTMTIAERNLLRDANSNQSLLTMIFSRPDPIYVPQSIGSGDFSGESELEVINPTAVRLGGIGEVALSSFVAYLQVSEVQEARVAGRRLVSTHDLALGYVDEYNYWWGFTLENFNTAGLLLEYNTGTVPNLAFVGPPINTYYNSGFWVTITHPTLGVIFDSYLGGSNFRISLELERNLITPVSENPTVIGNRIITIYETVFPSLTISADTELNIINPTAVNPAGIGTLAVDGESAIAVEVPTAIRVAGIASLAFDGDSTINITNPNQVRAAGIGTLAFDGDSAITVEASDIPIPTGITEGSTGEIVFGDYRLQWSNGFNETYRFRTGIVEHRGGTEQRIAHRAKPRVEYEFTAFLDQIEMRSFLARNSTDQGHLTHIPHPRDTIKAPQEIGTGGNFISFATMPGWMTAGSTIFAKLNQHIIPGVILGTSATGALLAFSNPIPMPIGTTLYRGAPIRPTSSQTINALTSRLGTMPVRAAGDPVDNWLPDYPATAPKAIDSKEYFDLKPNWSNPVGVGMTEDWEDIDFQRGAVSRVFPKLFPSRLLRYNYLLHTPDRVEHILGLFFRMKGRQKSFWMPSFMHEAQIAANTTRRRMVLPGNQFFTTYADSPVFKYLRIAHTSGVYTIEVRRIEEDDDGNSEVVFEEQLPASLTPNEITMISWINLVRFETDSLTLNWRTDGVAETTINVRTLEVEIPT